MQILMQANEEISVLTKICEQTLDQSEKPERNFILENMKRSKASIS